jgi:hypothetical protein
MSTLTLDGTAATAKTFDELAAHRTIAKNSHRRADDLTRGT